MAFFSLHLSEPQPLENWSQNLLHFSLFPLIIRTQICKMTSWHGALSVAMKNKISVPTQRWHHLILCSNYSQTLIFAKEEIENFFSSLQLKFYLCHMKNDSWCLLQQSPSTGVALSWMEKSLDLVSEYLIFPSTTCWGAWSKSLSLSEDQFPLL